MERVIVIITDDIVFSHLLSSLLYIRLNNVIVKTCETYQDIDTQIDASTIALNLIDGQISTLSSIEAIRYLRTKKSIVTPIWFFPEIVNEAYIYKIKEMGANRTIYRPFDPYVIVTEIESLLSPIIPATL
jgi:DNA-binding response OmpR family regulator